MTNDRYHHLCKYFPWWPPLDVFTFNQVSCKYFSHGNTPALSIYKFLQLIVNTSMQILKHVFTFRFPMGIRSIIFLDLVLALVGCRTPKETIKEHQQTTLQDSSSMHATKNLDDTTTITHKQVDSTTQVITIIRKIREESDQLAQSLHQEDQQSAITHTDTITTAVVNRIMKGIAIVCIGLAVIAAVFFILLVIIIIKLRK